jgi:aminomethyltransferase
MPPSLKRPLLGENVTLKGGFETRVTRCGYTGEDGFEISMKYADAEKLARVLLGSTAADVQPCGLGARDSLRLEAGLCLYGHDLDTSIDPVQAGLLWTIGPKGARRRVEQGFAGAHNILKPDGGPLPKTKKRVGFMGHSQPIREGAPIFDMEGQ